MIFIADFKKTWRNCTILKICADRPADLIAILVRTGLCGVNAVDIGKQLVQKIGSLIAIAQASGDELQCVRGIGCDKAVKIVKI